MLNANKKSTMLFNRKFLLLTLLLISFVTISYCQNSSASGQVKTDIDTFPAFPGGDIKRIKFIEKNLIYPKEARQNNIKGTVLVKFTIDSTGKILHETISIEKGINPLLDNEAIKLVKLFPDWKPAFAKGKSVRCQMIMPIRFGKGN